MIQATEKKPRRVDDEHERVGNASIFMFAEPLSGWHQATARPHRTQSEAIEVARWLEDRYVGKKKSHGFAITSILILRERFMRCLSPSMHVAWYAGLNFATP